MRIVSLLFLISMLAVQAGGVLAAGSERPHVYILRYFVHSGNPSIMMLKDGSSMVSAGEMSYLRVPGKPVLPYRSLIVALPPGALKVRLLCKTSNPASIMLPSSLPLSMPPASITGVSHSVQSNLQYPYPGRCAELLGIYRIHGAPLALIHVYPFHAVNSSLIMKYDISLEIRVEASGKSPGSVPRLLWRIVSNPYDLDSWGYSPIGEEAYVILAASEDMIDALKPLARLRAARGFKTYIYTLSDIDASYTEASLQDKIRAFARYAMEDLNATHLVLAGDVPLIPAQYFYAEDIFSELGESEEKATDLYYALLDGSWDPNGNGRLLESLDSDGDNYPENNTEPLPDVAADIYVGRIPADNATHLSMLVGRIVSRETDPPLNGWDHRMLFFASILNYANEDGHGWPKTDDAKVADLIANNLLPEGIQPLRAYEEEGLDPSTYPHEYPLNTTTVSSLLREGALYMYSAAHGSPSANYRKIWSVDDGDGVPESGEMTWKYFLASYMDLVDGGGGLIGYIDSCLSGWYDYRDGLAEALLNDGATGIVASSRVSYYHVGWSNPSTGAYDQEFAYLFWQEALGRASTLGEALYASKLDYATEINVNAEYASKKDFLVYNLLGDPGAWLHINASKRPLIHVEARHGELLVNVTSIDGSPMSDMLVSVMTEDAEVIARGYTGSDGTVVLLVPPETVPFNETLYISAAGTDTLVGFAEINSTQLEEGQSIVFKAHATGFETEAPINTTARIYLYFTVNGTLSTVSRLSLSVSPKEAYVGSGVIETDIGPVYYVDLRLNRTGQVLVAAVGSLGTYNASIVVAKDFVEPRASKKDMENISYMLSELNATLMRVSNGVATINTSLGVVHTRLESLNASIAGLSEQGVVLETMLGALETRLDAINATLLGLKGDLAVINTSLGILVLGLNTSSGDIKGMLANLTGLVDQKYTLIEASIEDLEPRLSTIEKGMASIDTKLGSITASLESLGAEIKSIADDVIVLKTSLGEINATLSDLEACLTGISGNIALINTSIGMLRLNISSLSGGLEMLRGEMHNNTLVIETKLGLLQADLEALNASLIDIETRIEGSTSLIVAKFNTSLGIVEATLAELKSTIVPRNDIENLSLEAEKTRSLVSETRLFSALAAVLAAAALIAALLRRS